jgi:hypothetical protein
MLLTEFHLIEWAGEAAHGRRIALAGAMNAVGQGKKVGVRWRKRGWRYRCWDADGSRRNGMLRRVTRVVLGHAHFDAVFGVAGGDRLAPSDPYLRALRAKLMNIAVPGRRTTVGLRGSGRAR